jgi:putative lipoic acid-binding regulatory protein
MDGDRDRTLALLKATHQFPVEYHLSVITRHEQAVFDLLRSAVEAGPQGPLAEDAYQRVPSSGAKYASHRFRVRCQSAEEVLELYARVKAVEGVLNIL